MLGINYHQGISWMSFTERFLQLRKQNGLTLQQMAETVDIHITQVKRYEAGEKTRPSLEILKKIAVAFNVSTDWLLCTEGERRSQNDLNRKFEAIAQMSEVERRAILNVLGAVIFKHQAQGRVIPNTGSPG